MLNVLSVRVGSFQASASVTPEVDGIALPRILEEFERDRGYEPVGGYGGLIPAYFNFGDLGRYFLGQDERQFPEPGLAYLLGCGDCGEVGCWPLEASISVSERTVAWTRFAQPHRRTRDYSALGPFLFDRTQYERAVRDMTAELRTASA